MKNLPLIFVVITIAACNKEEESYSVHVVNAAEITYESARVTISYELTGNENYVDGGFCLSKESNPDLDDYVEQDQVLNSETNGYYLFSLDAGTTYHVRGFLSPQNQSTIWSPDYTFTTAPTPDAPCTLFDNFIDFGTTGETYLAAEGVQQFDLYYSVKAMTSGEDGYIDFRFEEFPSSGIYYASSDYISPTDHEVGILVNMPGPGSCAYNSGNAVQVYVTSNEETGHIEIEFCGIGLATDSGCSSVYYTDVSGRIIKP